MLAAIHTDLRRLIQQQAAVIDGLKLLLFEVGEILKKIEPQSDQPRLPRPP